MFFVWQTRTSLHRAPIRRCRSGGVRQRQRRRWRSRFHKQHTLRNARFFLGGGNILDILRVPLRPCPDASPEAPDAHVWRWRGASPWRRGVRGWRRAPLRRRAAGRPTLLDALWRPQLRSVRECCFRFQQSRHPETPHVALLAVGSARIPQAADGVDRISLIRATSMVF